MQSPQSRFLRLVLPASLLAGSLLVSAVPSVMADSGPWLTGNVVGISGPASFYASAPSAVSGPATPAPMDARYYVVSGTLDSSGAWRYPLTYHTTGDTPGVVRELAIDPTTHRELVVTGLVSAAEAAAAIKRDQPALSGGSAPLSASPLTSGGYASHYVYTRWYDPLLITLSSAYDEADVYWDGSGNITSYGYNYSLYWDVNNGWHLTYNYLGYGIIPPEYGSYTYSIASMQTSSPFPSPTCGTTTTYYNPNEIYTHVGGQGNFNIDTWATSGCLFLINWEYYLG